MKANAQLNGEWAKHVRRFMKKLTAKIRRQSGKKQIRNESNRSN